MTMRIKFPCAQAACRISDPMDWTDEKRRMFVDACREMAEFHGRFCPEIGILYKKHGFDPSSIRTEADLERIPPLGVTAMKHYLLTSLPHDRAYLKLTSSGTGGQRTQVWFDEESLDRVQAMLESLWRQEGLVSTTSTNYLMFIYDPEEAKDLGIAFSDKNQQRFAPQAKVFYAIRKNSYGNWQFEVEKTISTLRDFAKEGKPVRIFGIPSFIHEILEVMEGRGEVVTAAPESLVMTGGGWKAAEEKSVTRGFFRSQITKLLGIPPWRVRDGYGMAEHSAPYIDCVSHRFHVPAYNHIIIRDPETMKPLTPGQTGLLELITPFNAMMPTLALLSTDLGYMNPDPCDCGHNSPTFTLVGRGGTIKHKGCALSATEIVRRG